ncbi:MAG: hypothetical protein ACJAUG_001043 [Halioglobus sp.]|jgi:hypothetical protein
MGKPAEANTEAIREDLQDNSYIQPKSLYTHAPLIAIFLLFVGISFIWIKVITPYGLATSTDSIYYLETATSFQDGKGASIADRELTAFGKEKVLPVTIWPPLYPALLAVLLSEPPNVVNVQYVSSFLLAISLTFIFLLLRRCTSSRAAFLLCVLYCFTVPVLLDYSFLWSETLFLPLYTGLLWSVVNYFEHDAINSPARRRYLIVLALLIAAMFYTRYAGICTPLILVYVFSLSKNRRNDLPYFISAGLIFSVPILLLMYSNLQLIGSVTGGDRPTPNLSLFDNIEHVVESLAVVFPLFIMIWGAAAALSGLFVFLLTRHLKTAPEPRNVTADSGIIVLKSSFFLAIFYAIAIVALRSVKFFDELGIRLISPAFPVFWVFLCALVFLKRKPTVTRFALGTSAMTLIICLTLQGWTFYSHIRSSVTSGKSPVYPYRVTSTHTNFTHFKQYGALSRLLAEKFPDLQVMASRRPTRMEWITGVPAVDLPKDFDANYVRQIAGLAERTSIAFLSQYEYDRFFEVSRQLEMTYEIYQLEETIFVALNP